MLVLGRKVDESIQIGDDIEVTILRIQGSSIRVGIQAPDHLQILRGEIESSQIAWHAETTLDSQQPSAAPASCK